jgi:hypothetical protein
LDVQRAAVDVRLTFSGLLHVVDRQNPTVRREGSGIGQRAVYEGLTALASFNNNRCFSARH